MYMTIRRSRSGQDKQQDKPRKLKISISLASSTMSLEQKAVAGKRLLHAGSNQNSWNSVAAAALSA